MKQRGFTIIEVALVLAIAGLIFLVVFLALPALQNSQKDTARKQDVGRVVSALQAYEADNGGNLPGGSWSPGYPSDGSTTSGFSGYLGTLSQTKDVAITSVGWTSYNQPGPIIMVFPGTQCVASSISGVTTTGTGPDVSTVSASQSDAAVVVLLSNGSTAYCANM
jgi:prepilin-type N-terminal cleavage/methylation domain-containing protein